MAKLLEICLALGFIASLCTAEDKQINMEEDGAVLHSVQELGPPHNDTEDGTEVHSLKELGPPVEVLHIKFPLHWQWNSTILKLNI